MNSFVLGLILLFSAVYAVLAWRRQSLAVAFLIFALPSYLIRFEVFGVPMTLLEVMILVLSAVFIVKLFSGCGQTFFEKLGLRSIRFSNYKWLIIALLFISLLAVIMSPNRLAALGIWKAYFLEPILFFIVFINTIKSRQDLRVINFALALSALIVALFAIHQKITGAFIFNELWAASETRRVTSFFSYPNAVGLYLAPIVVYLCGLVVLKIRQILDDLKTAGDNFFAKICRMFKKPETSLFSIIEIILFVLTIIGGALAIIFASSEGALVGLAAGLFLLGLLIKPLRLATLIVTAVVILMILFVPALNSWVTQKATFGDFSGRLRLIMYQETWSMIKSTPLWGGGLANYQAAVAPYHHAAHIFEIYLYPHQLFFNFWSELGVLGLLVFVLLIIKFFRNYLKVNNANREFYLVLLAVMTAILFHGLVDVPYFKNDLSVMWWLWFGLAEFCISSKETDV